MQFAKHFLIECYIHTEKRNKTWERDRKKVVFDKICGEKMLTCLRFAKKAGHSIKSLGLINLFRSKEKGWLCNIF